MKLGMEYFVAETLDQGFRNLDVYRTLLKVIDRRRPVRGMNRVFAAHLTVEGQVFVHKFIDNWLSSGNMWEYLNKRHKEMQDERKRDINGSI